jgi:hypothetical protein
MVTSDDTPAPSGSTPSNRRPSRPADPKVDEPKFVFVDYKPRALSRRTRREIAAELKRLEEDDPALDEVWEDRARLVAAQQTPPHVLGIGEAMLMLHSGINPVAPEVWSTFESHPSVVELTKAGHMGVLKELPRRDLEALAERTWSTAGLDAIAAAEKVAYGDKPRQVVVDAIATQRDQVRKHRTKPEPKKPVEPKAPVRPRRQPQRSRR